MIKAIVVVSLTLTLQSCTLRELLNYDQLPDSPAEAAAPRSIRPALNPES